jgi:hypothetical protein
LLAGSPNRAPLASPIVSNEKANIIAILQSVSRAFRILLIQTPLEIAETDAVIRLWEGKPQISDDEARV